MRILAFHPGNHDASAAAFDDYRLVAAVEEERLTRRKGSGDGVPWLAIDEVLRIAAWSRMDVDAVVSTRSFFQPQYFRYPAHRAMARRIGRWLGTEKSMRDLFMHCLQCGTADAASIFQCDDFLRDNGFRANVPLAFANHHEAHALPTLFFKIGRAHV